MVPKFEQQGRFSAGVAAILINNPDGSVEERGIRLDPFVYSMKEIASIGKWDMLVRTEIERVRNLSSDTKRGGWVVSTRPAQQYWEDDPVHFLPGIGKVTSKTLKDMGIILIKDLLNTTSILTSVNHENSDHKPLTQKRLDKLHQKVKCLNICPGQCPFQPVDYRRFPNPYEARYGHEWQEHIKKTAALSGYVSIKELVLHMNEKSKKAFEGTKYENDFYFFHDALTQLTDKKCVEWMIEKNIYKHWLKPELTCNDVVSARSEDGVLLESQRYAGRMVGNSPELNPLDNSGFRDLRCSIALNVAATWHLPKNNNLKFSLATPAEITRTFLRIWDPANGVAPSSRRILEDVKKVLFSLRKIVEAKGHIVPGLVNRNGHRKPRSQSGYKLPGKKDTLVEMGIHSSIQSVVLDHYKAEKDLYFSKNRTQEK